MIGLVVPIAVLSLAAAGTAVAVLNRKPWENIVPPLIVAWSIATVIVLVAIVTSLNVVAQVRRAPAGIHGRSFHHGSKGFGSDHPEHTTRSSEQKGFPVAETAVRRSVKCGRGPVSAPVP